MTRYNNEKVMLYYLGEMTNSKFNKSRNRSNETDYNLRTDGDYQRQADVDKIYETIENTNWSKESEYHNTYYNLKTNTYGKREIKMNNKKWHKLNKN